MSGGRARHIAVGEAGEDLAARHLEKKGYRIVERRVRFRRGELDIVARDGRDWVFVEVRTRTTARMGGAAEAMGPVKARRLARAAREYVDRHGLHDQPLRCDFLAVDLGPDGLPVFTHFPAFMNLE